MNGLLNYFNTRRVASVEYRLSSIGSDRHVKFTKMKLQNNNDVRTMFSIFGRYTSNGLMTKNNIDLKS